MSAELKIFSIPPFLKCLRVHPCEGVCIHEDPRFSIPPGGFNFSVDGGLVDALLYFSGFKVGQIHFSFLSHY